MTITVHLFGGPMDGHVLEVPKLESALVGINSKGEQVVYYLEPIQGQIVGFPRGYQLQACSIQNISRSDPTSLMAVVDANLRELASKMARPFPWTWRVSFHPDPNLEGYLSITIKCISLEEMDHRK